jgi:mannose-6-phosphate isomerase-like protein (cupin superfamily)
MNGNGGFVLQNGEGRPVHVLGNELTIKISSSDTGGAYTVFEGVVPPLTGPPLHRHTDQDESWYIIEGEYRFVVDGREVYARPGDTVFAPRGTAHTFQNIGSKPGRTLTTVVPGGIEVFFEELEAAVPRGAAPNPAKMAPVFAKHGQELLGPPLSAR